MYKIYTKPFWVPKRHVHKFLLIMRLTTLLIIATIMQVSASTYAQRITLREKNVPLEKVFEEIRRQSGYDFVFDRKLLQKANPVDISLKNASLEDALDVCFANQPFNYKLEEKTIVIKDKEKTIIEKIKHYFNAITVTGVVLDENDKPLSGVTVTIKGTIRNTYTNKVGSFILPDVDEDAVLVLTAVGREKTEVKVAGGTSLRIVLKLKINDLEEVSVSTGYQILQRKDMVGATSTVKMSDLYNNGISTIEQMIQGKLAGVVITNTSGMVGTRQTTRVRGTSTLTGTQEPIWVVDGIIQEDPLPFKAQQLNALGGITPDNADFIRNFVGNSVAWLNPNDIDEITVLKDAAATAIYGIRAANGVIVITTKRGKSGPMTINYSVSATTNQRVNYNKLNLMNSKERVAVSREIYQRGLVSSSVINGGIGYAGALNDYLANKTIDADQFNARVSALETQNTDWFKVLFRNPLSINHNLSFSGGTDRTSYYTSFGYNDTKGTAIGNDSRGYTANLSLTSQITKKFNISARLSASQKRNDGFYKVDPYNYASTMNRALSAYNADGTPTFYKALNNYQYNVQNELANTGNTNKVLSANTAIQAQYEVIPGLTIQTLYSYNSTATLGESYATEQTNYIANTYRFSDYGTVLVNDPNYKASQMPVGGEYNLDQNNSDSWNWRNSVSYNKAFHEKHVIAVMVGQEMSSTHYTGYTNTSLGYLRDRGKSFAILPATYGLYSPSVNPLLYQYVPAITDNLTNSTGVYLTSSYSYDNRYVANFSVRNDRSNRFGQFTNEKFNPVYAGGVKWNMANEKWFQATNWLSSLSLSGTYGYQRNIASNVSPDLIIKVPPGSGAQSTVVDQQTGDYLLTISSLPYANLRWEQNTSMNLGLDFSLFQSKIQGSFSYYTKRGKDLITSLNVPLEYGVNSMLVNGGSMNNSGYEVTASFVPVRTRNFTWSVSINTSKNTNKIIKTGDQLNTWETAVAGNLNKAGDPVSGFYAFDYTGTNKTTGTPTFNLAVQDGKDPVTDPTAYMKYMGKMDPDFTSGLGMNFRYKMFSLSSSFYLQVGGKKFLAPLYSDKQLLPDEYQNLSRDLLNRWTPANNTSNVPGLPDYTVPYVAIPSGKNLYLSSYNMYNYSTDRVVNASSFRCNNINMSYSLNQSLARRLRCKNINVGAGISNPFSINSKDFRGIDPEVATGGQPRTTAYTLNLGVSL